jgi:hypothetical protein
LTHHGLVQCFWTERWSASLSLPQTPCMFCLGFCGKQSGPIHWGQGYCRGRTKICRDARSTEQTTREPRPRQGPLLWFLFPSWLAVDPSLSLKSQLPPKSKEGDGINGQSIAPQLAMGFGQLIAMPSSGSRSCRWDSLAARKTMRNGRNRSRWTLTPHTRGGGSSRANPASLMGLASTYQAKAKAET